MSGRLIGKSFRIGVSNANPGTAWLIVLLRNVDGCLVVDQELEWGFETKRKAEQRAKQWRAKYKTVTALMGLRWAIQDAHRQVARILAP